MLFAKKIFTIAGLILLPFLLTACGDDPVPGRSLPENKNPNEPIPLTRTDKGDYLVPLKIGGKTYDFLIDTGISALVVFSDKVKAGDFQKKNQSVKLSTLNGTLTGTNGLADLKIGNYAVNDLKIIVAGSAAYKDETNQPYQGADGVLGLRFKRHGKFIKSSAEIDIPMASLLPDINLVEFDFNKKTGGSISLGVAPRVGTAKQDYLFYTYRSGVTDADDPVGKSFTDLEPETQIINTNGDRAAVPVLLGTSVREKLILDEGVAETLGYDRKTLQWPDNEEISLYIYQTRGNKSLKIPVSFPTSEIKVQRLSGASDTTGYDNAPFYEDIITVKEDDVDSIVAVIAEAEASSIKENIASLAMSYSLDLAPVGTVVIDISNDQNTRVKLSTDNCSTLGDTAQITLDPANYEQGEVVSFCPVNNATDDGDVTVTVTNTVNGGLTTDFTGYAFASVDNFTIEIKEDDKKELIFLPGSFTLSESGAPVQASLALFSPPSSGDQVDIDITSPDTSEVLLSTDGCASTATSIQLNFTESNYELGEFFSVCPQDETTADGDQSFDLDVSINGTTTDTSGYAAVGPFTWAVTVTDNDGPGFEIIMDSDEIEESGGSLAGTIGLTSLTTPDGDVVVDIEVNDPFIAQMSLDNCVTQSDSVQVSFTGPGYAIQEFYFCPFDDPIVLGDTLAQVNVTVNGGSTTDTTGYAGLSVPSFNINIVEDDVDTFFIPAVTSLPEASEFYENEEGYGFVHLDTPPNGVVVVDVLANSPNILKLSLTDCENPRDEVELIFDPGNWNIKQKVLYCPVDDNFAGAASKTAFVGYRVDTSGKNTDYKAVLGLRAWENFAVAFDFVDFQAGGPEGTIFFLNKDEPYETEEFYSYYPELNDNLVKLPGLNTIADEKYADISDDGKTIAFQSKRAGGAGNNDVYIYRRGKGTLELSGLNSAADDSDPSLSGDGKLVAFQSNRGGGQGDYDIYLYDIENEQLVNLPGLNSAHLERNPDLSADGNFISFRTEREGSLLPDGGGGSDVLVYDRSRQAFHGIDGLNTVYGEFDPVVSENGAFVAFDGLEREDALGENDIYLFDARSDTLVDLGDQINSYVRDGAVTLSSEGRYLAFDSARNDPELGSIGRDVFMFDVFSRETIFRPGLNSHFEDSGANLSRHGQYIVFHSKRPGAYGGFDVYLYKVY